MGAGLGVMLGRGDGAEVTVGHSVAAVVGLAVGVTPQAHNAIARQTSTYPGFFIRRFLKEDIIIIPLLINLSLQGLNVFPVRSKFLTERSTTPYLSRSFFMYKTSRRYD